MRKLLALAAAAVCLVTASPNDASAFHRDRTPDGWKHEHAVRHWVYYPRYHHYYLYNGSTDPYAYRYEPRGYYPYYNSALWKPRKCVPLRRAHFKHPTYYKAWGATKKRYHHVDWHVKHHGGHPRWDW